ncbi:MAG TPA: hypothetical protein PK867_03065, partial [Pirellulales bacterium]|nr:hypothetical protein [Pirellulales bacterium]
GRGSPIGSARHARRELLRDCQIYERHILEEGTQEHLAAEFGVTQQGAKQRRSGCRRMGFPARQVVQ